MSLLEGCELPLPKVGDTFALRMHGKHYKAHVLAIIDEEYVVYKWYGRHKQWWHYNIECWFLLEGRQRGFTRIQTQPEGE